jgi:hypothetical protein
MSDQQVHFVGSASREDMFDILRERYRAAMQPVVDDLKVNLGSYEKKWIVSLCHASDTMADAVCFFYVRSARGLEHIWSEAHNRCRISLRESIGLPENPQPIPLRNPLPGERWS